MGALPKRKISPGRRDRRRGGQKKNSRTRFITRTPGKRVRGRKFSSKDKS